MSTTKKRITRRANAAKPVVRRSCAKRLSPMNANTNNAVCSLKTDNHDCEEGWIIIDGNTVSLSTQQNGELETGKVTFKRVDFNRLIRWYVREQKTLRRNYA